MGRTQEVNPFGPERKPRRVCYRERLNRHVLPALGHLRLRALHRVHSTAVR